MADLLAREAMKLMDNEYGPVQWPMRGSYRAIRKNPKIRVRQFKRRDSNGRFDGPPIVFQNIVHLMVRQVIASHIPQQRAHHGGSEPPDHRNRLKWVPSAWFPLRASALRGVANERGEFLMTTLPVVDVSAPVTTGTVMISGLRR